MNALVNLGERIIQLEKERDSLINDITDIRKERDELIMSNHKVIQDNTMLKRKLDDVVGMVNAYVTAAKAYSGESAYDLLENELNRILEDE